MTKEQFEMVKSLLAQTRYNTNDGDFYLSFTEYRALTSSPYFITIYPAASYRRFPQFHFACISDVCAVVNAYYYVDVEQGLPIIRIS